jgi:glucosamine--fructose-6-phosphate aminotransferase (isomerizing)
VEKTIEDYRRRLPGQKQHRLEATVCGIVGYVGDRRAQPILLNCLRKLEYRGYDSCGIAVASGEIQTCKDVIRVDGLAKQSPLLAGSIGIGHTRWATHGPPSRVNAHPHLDCSRRIAVVHNGVVANYAQLKKQLIGEGHEFLSETDTEVIPHLVEKHFRGDLAEAVAQTLAELEGSYAFIVMMAGDPRLVVAKKDNPLVIGIGDDGNFIASDVPALLDYTNRVIYPEDGDMVILEPRSARIFTDGVEVRREEQKVLWGVDEARKGGYEHFMLKEIHEQPKVIRNTLADSSRNPEPVAALSRLRDDGIEALLMLACGTSYHASLVGKHIIEELLRVPVRVELASEFNYYSHALDKTLAIAITQSGETADTLKAMRRSKEVGCSILAITNVVGSSATRVANQTISRGPGPR